MPSFHNSKAKSQPSAISAPLTCQEKSVHFKSLVPDSGKMVFELPSSSAAESLQIKQMV